MVKGTPKSLSFQSKEKSPMKANEAMYNASPARPPLSAFSASARNNLGAENFSLAHPDSNSQSKLDGRSPQAKIRGGLSGQVLHPHLENADSNIGSFSSISSSPERFSFTHGTPQKRKSKRGSGSMRLPLGSAELGNVQRQNSTGVSEECISRTSSNPSSDEEGTTTDDSDPSSTSGSEAENVSLSRQSAASRQEGLRRMSLGPKIEAAVTKLEKTPCKPLIPLAGRIGTPCASPGSLRAGVQRALVLHQPDLKDRNQAQSHFDLQENLSFWDDHNVQVVIRTRPISVKEAAKQDFSRCLRQDGPHAITWLGPPETRFTFDHVAGETISQEKLFKVIGLPIVENCMAGYNSCMFAYGQTGSGKTHTMLGDITGLGDRPNDNRGMTPRIFEYLFSKIQQEEQDRQLDQLRYVCKCSFLEIYNEQITDLLEPSSSNLQMREDSKKGVYVENLTEMVVSSVQDVVLLLLKGAANRKVASTNMNRESSRSHSVFTCSIESKWETNSISNMRFGRLNLVDLAGSERQKSSGAGGDRLKEAASINKSLSTLGLVIMTLVDIANGKPRHVPYRDSKLTFLLQDSLGGNSKTAIIATISPSSCCSMETLGTLKFAQRAKFIQNNAVVNEDASGEVLALRHEIQQLKEEVSRLRCQTISSIRRECRRDSNEFFRLSMTGRDLFDAAEKERTNEGADLKSAELLEKIKALEVVLAGALRREQVADTATIQLSAEFEKAKKLIEERDHEVRNCKNLLHLRANESLRLESSEDIAPFSDSNQHVIMAEKLEIAGSLEYNSTVTELEMENFRLTGQLRSYQTFFDAGEKEIMAAEIQGLRDQVLELLDGKIAVERGPLSTTIAQGDSYRKELETCRNDLTKCLEASSQLQRQVDELNSLVNQLTAQCSDKEKELDQMKESTVKYANIAKLKEEEINTLQTGWETATANLYCHLVEGERALVEVGQEMDGILGEDWLLKNMQDTAVRWSIESVKSLKEVDVEHDYFQGRDSCNTDDIFGEKRISRRKRSFGVTPRVSIMSEEKLKLEASVARLEQELEEHKQRALKEKHIQVELDRVEREKHALKEEVEALVKNSLNTSEILEENAHLTVEVQQLRVKLHEQNEAIEISRAQIAALDRKLADLEKVKLDQAEVLTMRSQEASGIREEKLTLLHETAILRQDLKDMRVKAEETEAALVDMARVKDELIEESAMLKLQADKNAVQQTYFNTKISDLQVALKTQQEEMSELETEIERLEFSLHEAECRYQKLETTMKADKESIVVLEEAKQKLDSEVKMISQKLALTDTVQEELRITVSALHVELEKKTEMIEELDLQATSRADASVEELQLSAAHLKSRQMRIDELETSVAEKSVTLGKLEEALMSATVTCDTMKMERDEARAHAAEVQAEASLNRTEIQELLEKLDLKSIELQILSDLMQLVTSEMSAHIVHLQSTSKALSQELEHERTALRALQHQLLSVTTTLERNQADLLESNITENNLLAEILSLKEKLFKSETNVDVTREAETRLHEEMLALSDIVKSSEIERHGLKEELAALQALVLEHQRTIEVNQQKIEADVQTITLLNATVEHLQIQLQRKDDLLHGLEFDLSLLQEHAVEDTNFKQELLKANARILELQEVVGARCEELKELGAAKNDVEEQLALKAAAKMLVEDRLLKTEIQVALVTSECQTLNSRVSQLHTSTNSLEAELAEKNEALSSLEKELMVARDTLTRMAMECSHKTEALLSLQGEMQSVAAERDDLKSQCSSLVEKVDYLQDNIAQQVVEVEVLHGELLVSMMTECCLQELKSDMETKAADLETQKAANDAEIAHTNENMKRLNFKLLRTSETIDQLKQEKLTLEAYIAELQAERACLNSQLAQKSEFESLLQEQILAVSESARQSLAEQDKMKIQIEDFQSLNCRLERDLALKIDAIISLEAEVMAAKTLTAQSLEQNAELRARISNFEEKHCDMERDIVLKKDAVSSVAAELSEAQATTSSMARDLDDMNWRITTLISEKDSLENKILQKDNAMASMDVELTAVKESLSSLELLRSKLSELELQKGIDENELKMSRKTQIVLQGEIQDSIHSQESNNTLKLELAKNITELSSLQDELSIASGSLSYNHEEIKVMKAEIEALLEERDSLQADLCHKSATISSLESELVGAHSTAETSRECIAASETNVAALQAERDILDKQITELELGVISTLKIELTEAQKSLKFLDNDMAEAKRVADSVSDENAALQAQVVGLEAEKGTLEVEISCKTALIMSLEAELATASSSFMALREELNSLGAQVLELQTLNAALETVVAEKRTSISLRESELLSTNTISSSKVQENDELRMQIDTWQQKCCAMEAQLDMASQEMNIMKAQITQQELQLSSLEELLAREAEALQHMVNSSIHATQECDKLRSEVDDLKDILCTKNAELKEQENAVKSLEICMSSSGNESDELSALKDERDQALVQVQALHGELRAAQALVASHKSSVLEAQKFAEVNILRASGKEEEARTLKASASTLKNQNSALEKQLEATKHEAERLRQSRDEFEMELQGMKNRMKMLQAVHSTGSRNFKGFQAAQAASLDLQKRLEDKESEVSQMYKRMTVLHSQNEAQASRLEEMETELAHVHQELDELQSQCEDKDSQLNALNEQLKEAETLTQDVMRDLHNVKLDISNYASLVSQQQLELIAERARHTDDAREKDEELSNLQTQLNQERQNWMVEMNHKQAEIVVARVLSEKMRLKNKTLAAEYKRLKADYGGKKKKLKFLEQQLTQLTTETRRFSMGTESEADFDEVQQFQALLAQANDHERAQRM